MKTKYKSDSKILLSVPAVCLLALIACFSSAFAGSLWREAVTDERGMFSDKRARRVGDIITIIINERPKFDVIATTQTDKQVGSNTQAGLGTNLLNQFIAGITSRGSAKTAVGTSGTANYDSRFPTNLLPRESGVPKIFDPSKFGDSDINVRNNRLSTQQVLTFQVAVQVIDVLPNGNLVVEGMRQLSHGSDSLFMALKGILRPYDVTAQNTIPSTLVADMRLDYLPAGDLAATQRKGWLQRIDEKISPW